jgi:DNA polymerase III subunit gamma/tau
MAATAAAPVPHSPPPTPSGEVSSDWAQIVQQLGVTAGARELARHTELRKREGNVFDLVVPKSRAYLAERTYQDKLKAALEQYLGAPAVVKLSVAEAATASIAAAEALEREAQRSEAVKSVKSDGFVNDLVNMFDGRVVDSTIRKESEMKGRDT